MATNDALFSVTGYVATQPKKGETKSGTKTLTFRIGWTPREVSRQTGEWADLPSSFASVTCFRKIAENAAHCLRKGDPIVLKGTLRVREYADQTGTRRNSVDVVADFLGHDLAKGTSMFSKHPQRAQQTAEEYAQSQASDGTRLPGDVAAEQPFDGLQADVTEAEEYAFAGGPAVLPDDPDDLAHGALADLHNDDVDDADGDDPHVRDALDMPDVADVAGLPDAPDVPDVPDVPDAPGGVGTSEVTKSRGRTRKLEPVGAGS